MSTAIAGRTGAATRAGRTSLRSATLVVALAAALTACPADEPEEELAPEDTEPRSEVAVADEEVQAGEALFEQNCMACHQADGSGAADGTVPALADNPFVTADEADGVIVTLLDGRSGMPSFGHLDDGQLAEIITYIRQMEGNDADSVDADDIDQLREDD